MGTNYYAESSPCKECGHVMTRTHIGKASGGWPFLFRCYMMHPTTYQEWLQLLSHPKITIRDEYGDIVLFCEFRNIVDRMKNFIVKDENIHHFYYDSEGYRFSYTEFS